MVDGGQLMSAAKRKGTTWETAVTNYLRDQDIDARRVAQTGRKDTGDIHGGGIVWEAKDHKSIDVAGFVRQAVEEAKNAGLPVGVAVVKRRQSNVKNAYVMTDLETFVRLIKALTT